MALRQAVEPGRLCGLWIDENGLDWPQHDLLLPSAVAMTLRFDWCLKIMILKLISSFIFFPNSSEECFVKEFLVSWIISPVFVTWPHMCVADPGIWYLIRSGAHVLRSEARANDIYASGMQYLRAHRVATVVSQRPLLISYTCIYVCVPADGTGTIFFFGTSSRSSMLLGQLIAAWVCHIPHASMYSNSCWGLPSPSPWRSEPPLLFLNIYLFDHAPEHRFCWQRQGYNWRFFHNFLEEDQMKWAKCI